MAQLASDPAQCYFGLWRVDKEGFNENPPISAGGIVYREDRVCLRCDVTVCVPVVLRRECAREAI